MRYLIHHLIKQQTESRKNVSIKLLKIHCVKITFNEKCVSVCQGFWLFQLLDSYHILIFMFYFSIYFSFLINIIIESYIFYLKNSEKVFTISQLTSFRKQIICTFVFWGMEELLRMLKNTEKEGGVNLGEQNSQHYRDFSSQKRWVHFVCYHGML